MNLNELAASIGADNTVWPTLEQLHNKISSGQTFQTVPALGQRRKVSQLCIARACLAQPMTSVNDSSKFLSKEGSPKRDFNIKILTII